MYIYGHSLCQSVTVQIEHLINQIANTEITTLDRSFAVPLKNKIQITLLRVFYGKPCPHII